MEEQTLTAQLEDILNVASGEKEFLFDFSFDLESTLYLVAGALLTGVILIFISKRVIK